MIVESKGAMEPNSQEPAETHRRISAQQLGIALIVAFAALLATILPEAPTLTKSVEEWASDLRIALFTPREAQHADIIIVALTDETLDLLPYRLPVDRGYMAGLIRTLNEKGVRLIGIDILFDRYTEPVKDNILKRALDSSNAPIVPIWAGEDMGVVGERLNALNYFVAERPSGHGALLQDTFDGTIRRMRPLWDRDSEKPLQFPAAIAEVLGTEIPSTVAKISWRRGPSETPGAFKSYPAHSIANLPTDWFHGKIALIGVDLVDIDRHRTPFNLAPGRGDMAGIEVHAHALAQLLNQRSLPVTGAITNFLIGLMVSAAGVAIALIRRPLTIKLFWGFGLIIGFWAIGFGLFAIGGPLTPLAMPTLAFAAAAGMASAFDSRREQQRRALIRRAFSQYVPPMVVARLDRDPSRLTLGGERREITVLFTDLQGFTSFSERVEPRMLGEIINQYLDGIGSIILKHEGTIDKFLGDGSMCFFGAPEAHDDDPERAVRAALEIDDFSRSFTKRLAARGVEIGETRIGIHTGTAVVGNFGGRDRFDYTAIGDAVNTASRLEGANRHLGTTILLSGATRHRLTGITVRPVGDLALSGKELIVPAFEALHADDLTQEFVSSYSSAYGKMSRDPEDALAEFEKLAAARTDPVVLMHLARLRAGETGTVVSLKDK
jgi:class 3 adenylate cyclase/CHASE2 domain-containing sensor protein